MAEEPQPDAAAAAQILAAETEARLQLQVRAAAAFKESTARRLKAAARAREKQEEQLHAAAAARRANAVHAAVITRRIPKKPVPQPQPQPPAPLAPQEPTRLQQARATIMEQVDAARLSMLACTVGADEATDEIEGLSDSEHPSVADLPPQEGPQKIAYPTIEKPRAAVAPVSTLRAVSASAAMADRKAALHSRLERDAEARRKQRLARLSESIEAERKAAEQAETLRREVEALEEEARQKERALADAAAEKKLRDKRNQVVESERYFEALRHQLREEARKSGRPLPPLCACGLEDPFEDHVRNCCRNCIFFNNPAAYRRALSGLFVRPIDIA